MHLLADRPEVAGRVPIHHHGLVTSAEQVTGKLVPPFDFGVAAVVQDPTVRISVSVRRTGTLHYMSPQQLSGLTPQPTDDFYSLGATLYDLLSGQPPFSQGDTPFVNEACGGSFCIVFHSSILPSDDRQFGVYQLQGNSRRSVSQELHPRMGMRLIGVTIVPRAGRGTHSIQPAAKPSDPTPS